MSLDLNALKENIQTLFQDANTTTASVPLSNGLTTKVQEIYKINPARISIQATNYPFVTIYISNKQIENADIARTQANAKRKAEIDVKVVGATFNSIYTNIDEDAADDECEDLMENIEQILRNNPTLSNFATWSYPTAVEYHSTQLDEQSIVRAGMLSLKTVVFY